MNLMMKTLVIFLFAILFAGCSDSSDKKLDIDMDEITESDVDESPDSLDEEADEEEDNEEETQLDEDVKVVTEDECDKQNREYNVVDGTPECGDCNKGFLEEDSSCRTVVTCDDLSCGENENKECITEKDHQDAQCGDCVTHAVVVDGTCVIPNCDEGAPGSKKATCDNLHKKCKTEMGLAFCDECKSGYVEELGQCQPVISCNDIDCDSLNKVCVPGNDHTHAVCGECVEGYEESNGECSKVKPILCGDSSDTDSMARYCLILNKECVEDASGARCEGCLQGYYPVEESEACVPEGTCSSLNCDAKNRECSDAPTGHCTDCKAGFTEDAGENCRAVLTCSDVTCSNDDEVCVEAGDNTDAFCRKYCGETAIWNGTRCEPCPACNGEGEAGVWQWPTNAGNCICKTEPGYFYSVGADMGTFRCDKDNDGWVRESARIFIFSDDDNLKENARCDLRRVDKFKLINENGDEKVKYIDPVSLFETDRNDDELILSTKWSELELPLYETGGNARNFKPAELNSLTKACHSLLTDYNDNGIADVDEYGLNQTDVFRRFSYFMELYQGYYEVPENDELYGTYVIREKQRPGETGDVLAGTVPMSYSIEDGERWKTCNVLRDTAWEKWKVTMDFAEYSDGSWEGLNHHSQFKCMVIDSNALDTEYHKLTQLQYKNENYTASICSISETTELINQDGEQVNPDTSIFNCTIKDSDDLASGDVVWSSVPFIPHGKIFESDPLVVLDDRPYKFDTYVRGCVDQCIESIDQCYTSYTPETTKCKDDPDNFGAKIYQTGLEDFCISVEICNGHDDTNDGLVDEGNPEGGEECLVTTDINGNTVSYKGVCLYGIIKCPKKTGNDIDMCCEDPPVCSGCFTCEAEHYPGELSEVCNGLDDDCDGDTDETFPEQGDLCYEYDSQGVPLKGICGIGETICQDGEIACQTQPPRDEECTAGVTGDDEDCDGEVDEAPNGALSVVCPSPWKLYYKDSDEDGFGPDSDFRCLCNPDIVNKYTALKAGDCCDNDDRVNPQSGTSSSDYNNCGTLDYNCDGVVDTD